MTRHPSGEAGLWHGIWVHHAPSRSSSRLLGNVLGCLHERAKTRVVVFFKVRDNFFSDVLGYTSLQDRRGVLKYRNHDVNHLRTSYAVEELEHKHRGRESCVLLKLRVV